MKIEKDKFVKIEEKNGIGTFVYIPSNYPGPIALDAAINQPERSKREDHKGISSRMYIDSDNRNFPNGCGALNSMET